MLVESLWKPMVNTKVDDYFDCVFVRQVDIYFVILLLHGSLSITKKLLLYSLTSEAIYVWGIVAFYGCYSYPVDNCDLCGSVWPEITSGISHEGNPVFL